MKKWFLLGLIVLLALAGCSGAADVAGEPTADSVEDSAPLATVEEAELPPAETLPAAGTDSDDDQADDGKGGALEQVTPELPVNSAELPEGPVITFQQSGGIMGLDDTWIIYGSGQVTKNGEKVPQATPDEVANLLASIERTGFFDLSQGKPAENVCCDFFYYVLTIQDGQHDQTIAYSDGDTHMPEEMLDAVFMIQEFLRARDTQGGVEQ